MYHEKREEKYINIFKLRMKIKLEKEEKKRENLIHDRMR